jgi:hypothetical protein
MFGVYKCNGSFFYFSMSSKVIEMRVRFQTQGKYQVVTEEHNCLMLAVGTAAKTPPLSAKKKRPCILVMMSRVIKNVEQF